MPTTMIRPRGSPGIDGTAASGWLINVAAGSGSDTVDSGSDTADEVDSSALFGMGEAVVVVVVMLGTADREALSLSPGGHRPIVA